MAGSDNGLTLLKYGLLIRKKEQQRAEIKKKDEKIKELQETIFELQNVAKESKYCTIILILEFLSAVRLNLSVQLVCRTQYMFLFITISLETYVILTLLENNRSGVFEAITYLALSLP